MHVFEHNAKMTRYIWRMIEAVLRNSSIEIWFTTYFFFNNPVYSDPHQNGSRLAESVHNTARFTTDFARSINQFSQINQTENFSNRTKIHIDIALRND